MVNLLLMLLYSAAGFTAGAAILGALRPLRSHPRYLMAFGAAVMPALWAIRALLGTKPEYFGIDLLVLMIGAGMVAAGWDAEAEIENRARRAREDADRGRRRAMWEQQRTTVGLDAPSQSPTPRAEPKLETMDNG